MTTTENSLNIIECKESVAYKLFLQLIDEIKQSKGEFDRLDAGRRQLYLLNLFAYCINSSKGIIINPKDFDYSLLNHLYIK